MLKSVRHNSARFSLVEEKVRPFEKLLMTLEGQLLDGMIFQNCVEQLFDDGQIFVTKNSLFAEEFAINIRNFLGMIEPKICELNETRQRHQYVAVVALYILHFQLFRSVDKKLFKSIWDVHKKLPGIILAGNVIWFAPEYLLLRLPSMAKALEKKAQVAVATRQNFEAPAAATK